MLITNVMPKNIGIATYVCELDKEMISNVIMEGTELPVSKTISLFTVVDNQREMILSVYENIGREEFVDFIDGLLLGNIEVSLPQVPKGTAVDFIFSMNKDGILSINAKCGKNEWSLLLT